MIRLCPNCGSERPLTEIFCEGIKESSPCHWDLSTVEITQPAINGSNPTPTPNRTCPNGHPASVNDLICPACGEFLDSEQPSPEPISEPVTVIDGWRLETRLPSTSATRERYVAVNQSDSMRAVLTLYTPGAEPDPEVYEVIRRLPPDHVPSIISIGRWHDRPYEILEELTGGTLATLATKSSDLTFFREVVDQLGQALHAFAQVGLRHRDLRPGAILVRSTAPLDLAISGFGSARLSDLDLDIVSPLEQTRYMAPEAIAGGVTPAADWWSLGIVLLELLTDGSCFAGINDQAFLIHILTNGAPLPDDLDPAIDKLLRGLLATDRRDRWQWEEVRSWLAGEPVTAPEKTRIVEPTTNGATITLSATAHVQPTRFALAAADSKNWDEARELLLRGVLVTWASDAKLDPSIQALLRQLNHVPELSGDLRLTIALKALHPAMPLVVRGNILTPAWLLDHPDEGYALINGPGPALLRKLGTEDWLSKLQTRLETMRSRATQLEIELNEADFRINALSTSAVRLASLWEAHRKLFPDTDHAGLLSLSERRQTTEEDLILLLSASTNLFRPASEVLEEAANEAARAQVNDFSLEDARLRLEQQSRRELFKTVDQRIANFSRCAVDEVDNWADQFRLDRRLSIARVLVLLSLPPLAWKELPRQSYVSAILEFFSKKISGAILRGPLARMTIGRTTARIDINELGTARIPASELLNGLIGRNNRRINIDPQVFADDPLLERRIRTLHSNALLYRRDTGIDGLYLGFPFAIFKDPKPSIKPRIAPVLLWPVRITPEVGNRGHITISFGRDSVAEGDADLVVLNPAFEGLIGFEATRRWQEAANDLLTRASISSADVMDAFANLARVRGEKLSSLPTGDITSEAYRPDLVPAGVLFHLTFMGQAVVKDLDHLKGRPPSGTGLETALRLVDHGTKAPPLGEIRELDRYFTADSDPSQECAVMEARTTPGLVVEGPPGTGKSQTIVNMIADAIGRNKTLLVVCQKQAALEVVRKRLEKENLGSRFAMVTDINRDREPIVRAVREQVEAIHATATRRSPGWKRERERLAAKIEALENELNRHHASLHQLDEATGLTYRTLIGELLALQGQPISPLDLPALRQHLASQTPGDIATLEENLGPLARYWLPAAFEDSALTPLKVFSADQATLDAFSDAFKAFVTSEAAREQTNAETTDAFPTNDGPAVASWLSRYADSFRSLSPSLAKSVATCIDLFAPPVATSPGSELIAKLNQTKEAISALNTTEHSSQASALLRATPSDALVSIERLAARASAPLARWKRLNLAAWRRRYKLRRWIVKHGIAADQDGLTRFAAAARLELLLRPLREEIYTTSQMLFARTGDPGMPPADLVRLASNLITLLSKSGELVSAIYECVFKQQLVTTAETCAPEAFDAFLDKAERSLRRYNARVASANALADLKPYFEDTWISLRQTAIDNERSNFDATSAIVKALPTLSAFQQYRIRSSRLSKLEHTLFRILRSRSAQLAALPPASLDSSVRHTISHEARMAWKTRMETAAPELLLEFDAIEAKIQALADADGQIRRCNQDLLRDDFDRSAIASLREWEAVTRLRGQRSLRLREFFDKGAALGLMAMRPVWLMTPDIASRLLQPKAAMFDAVIYDEASQMPIEYALPTLFRARTVVVSGDEKQMPPTNFFSSKVENDEADLFENENDENEAEENAFDETWNRRDIKDCPDLLHLARTVLPSQTLQIHYRSAYRELIAFSNASFYGDRLNVPARHPEDTIRQIKPIEVIEANGLYDQQTNRQEAEAVAAYLQKLWRHPSPPSVGVVTFNRKQANEIDEVLEEVAEEDSDFRDALSREQGRVEGGEDVGFFVKNVENVQGDERDIIVFSSTFGINKQNAFRRAFGVLGQTGGERRLNVAVTRARQKVVLVTSMPVARVSHFLDSRGPARIPRDYLQAYLEYARLISRGELGSADTLLKRLDGEAKASERRHQEPDGFAESVKAFLFNEGWDAVEAHDGSAFGLDLAIKHPDTGLFAIGIECDAPIHPLLTSAKAREVWRPRVLERAVSQVHRVSSYSWLHSPDFEKQRLRSAVENALKQGRT